VLISFRLRRFYINLATKHSVLALSSPASYSWSYGSNLSEKTGYHNKFSVGFLNPSWQVFGQERPPSFTNSV